MPEIPTRTLGNVVAERDFLLERSRVYHRDVGRSSIALVHAAITGHPVPTADWPFDAADLARCVRTYSAAPVHLRAAMVPWIERFTATVTARKAAA